MVTYRFQGAASLRQNCLTRINITKWKFCLERQVNVTGSFKRSVRFEVALHYVTCFHAAFYGHNPCYISGPTEVLLDQFLRLVLTTVHRLTPNVQSFRKVLITFIIGGDFSFKPLIKNTIVSRMTILALFNYVNVVNCEL